MTTGQTKLPHPLISFIPIIALVCLMALTISIFGADSLSGGTQVSLLVATAVCVCISMWVYHTPWQEMERSIKKNIGDSAVSIIILLIIGMMSASWMISGVVPTMIYYGVQVMSPQFFLVCSCVICAIVSVMTGSSWTTVATMGIALLGIGNALGLPNYWTAGAIISGAYFGDKISPLSDTTILASTATDVNLFTHIKYMLRTTTPSMAITLVIYLVAGFVLGAQGEIQVDEYTTSLDAKFNISAWTLIVPVVTAIMIAKKVPSLITLFISSLLAGITAVVLQPNVVLEIAGNNGMGDSMDMIKGLMTVFFASTDLDTGSQLVNELVATNGMAGMLDTIWLILCAMCFGGSMIASGMIQSITMLIIRGIRNTTSLVSSTVFAGIMSNILTCDQYMSIILTANIFKDVYKKKGYEGRLLSRTTEDAVTVTSVLIPWNTCGMTQSTVLGVATIAYLPFCFFNYISPLMSIIVAMTGWQIKKHDPQNLDNQPIAEEPKAEA